MVQHFVIYVSSERSIITCASPYATFFWMLTSCLLATEFVFPFPDGVISSLSHPPLPSQLFSLVLTCSRLKTPYHQPSQQGLSSRASHSWGTVFQVCLRHGFTSLWFSCFWEGHTFSHSGWSVQANSCVWDLWTGSGCFCFGVACRLMQMLWPEQLRTSANSAGPCSGCAGFAAFVTSSDLDSEFHTGNISFQTPQQCSLSEGASFLVRFSSRFICCVVKFVSVSRLNCCKDKSPDTNGFVAGRCWFSLLFEIIPFESHCYLHYWHTL